MKTLKIGLIGTGFMGKAHAIAFNAASSVFELPAKPVCELLADADLATAESRARAWGFARATDDWRALVEDSDVDVVDICAPNFLHKEMALAAIAAGKHVYAEKPLALSAADADEMVAAAEKAGVKTLVGFNYIRNSATQLARQIVASGEIGELIHFRGRHNEDYLLDPQKPHDWHTQRATAGAGALGDVGSHILNMAEFLTGQRINEVCGQLQTVIASRPNANGSGMAPVENDDQAQAMSELQLYRHGDAHGRRGFTTLLAGPEHPDYAAFSPAPGHGLGYNDQKIIEVRDLVEGIINNRPLYPDFREAARVNRLIEAIETSHQTGQWVTV